MTSTARATLALPLVLACAPELGNPFIADDGGHPCYATNVDGAPPCAVSPELDAGPGYTTLARAAEDGTRLVSISLCGSNHAVDIQLYPGRGVFAAGPVVAGVIGELTDALTTTRWRWSLSDRPQSFITSVGSVGALKNDSPRLFIDFESAYVTRTEDQFLGRCRKVTCRP